MKTTQCELHLSHEFHELEGVPDGVHHRVLKHGVDAIIHFPPRGVDGLIEPLLRDRLERLSPLLQ